MIYTAVQQSADDVAINIKLQIYRFT